MQTEYKLPNNETFRIVHDVMADSPRNADNITTMIFFGNNSNLGDKHEFNSDDHSNWDEMEIAIKKHYGRKLVHIQKVCGYSHSGLTISLKPFQCQFDSGVLGFVIVTRQDILDLLGNKRVTKKLINQAISQIESEIEILNQYIIGDTWGVQLLDCDGAEYDSCYGYFGSDIKTNGMLRNISSDKQKFIEQQLS